MEPAERLVVPARFVEPVDLDFEDEVEVRLLEAAVVVLRAGVDFVAEAVVVLLLLEVEGFVAEVPREEVLLVELVREFFGIFDEEEFERDEEVVLPADMDALFARPPVVVLEELLDVREAEDVAPRPVDMVVDFIRFEELLLAVLLVLRPAVAGRLVAAVAVDLRPVEELPDAVVLRVEEVAGFVVRDAEAVVVLRPVAEVLAPSFFIEDVLLEFVFVFMFVYL